MFILKKIDKTIFFFEFLKMDNLNFSKFLIGHPEKNNFICKILNGKDVILDEKYRSDYYTLKGIFNYTKIANDIECEKYLKMAVSLNNSFAMACLGLYYKNKRKYIEMEVYYKMAIEFKNDHAMYLYGLFHQYTSKNYDEMEMYYKMAIELNNDFAMLALGIYCKNNSKYGLAEKYLIMAADLNNLEAIKNLGDYYRDTQRFDEMGKYYKKAIEFGSSCTLIKYLDVCIKYNINIDLDFENTEIFTIKRHHAKYLESQIIFFTPNLIFKHIYENEVYNSENYDQEKKFCPSLVRENSNQEKKFCPSLDIDHLFFKPDFVINTQKNKYNIHSFVLDSNYFLCLFSGKYKITNEITMEIENEKTIELLIKYLYLGIFDWMKIENEVLDELEKICDEYEFSNLLKNCKIAKFLKNIVIED